MGADPLRTVWKKALKRLASFRTIGLIYAPSGWGGSPDSCSVVVVACVVDSARIIGLRRVHAVIVEDSSSLVCSIVFGIHLPQHEVFVLLWDGLFVGHKNIVVRMMNIRAKRIVCPNHLHVP